MTDSINPVEMQSIRESLDTGTEFASSSAYSMADALTTFLDSLAEPVSPLPRHPFFPSRSR